MSSGVNQLSVLGTNNGAFQSWTQNIFEENDTFSTVRGPHSLKFGVDFERVQLNNVFGTASRGAYQFGGLQSLLVDVHSHRGHELGSIGVVIQPDGHAPPAEAMRSAIQEQFRATL